MGNKETSSNNVKRSVYIGHRCKMLRKELGLTQGDIVDKTGAENQATISNLENKGMIGEFFWDYIEFLYQQGYNPNWIIIEENSSIPKKLSKGQGLRYYKDVIKKSDLLNTKIIEHSVQLKETLAELEKNVHLILEKGLEND